MHRLSPVALAAIALLCPSSAHAGENLFGYVRMAETMPKGAFELYAVNTLRASKGLGTYRAFDHVFEGEYGASDRVTLGVGASFLSIEADGLLIDGYLPAPIDKGPRLAGLEAKGTFNILSPAMDDVGLAVITTVEWKRLDPHSGQAKTEYEASTVLAAQKYLADGALVVSANLGVKAGLADRAPIDGLPEDFDWPTDPEAEIELTASTGATYRVAPNWFVGAEAEWKAEYETEVGQERWSLFAGPTLHYGGKRAWATLTWFPQIRGGGERYEGQAGSLHLIEKTETEVRLKLGYNF